MKVRAFPLLLAALALPVSLPARAASPFGPAPPIVQPGPPGLPIDPERWLPWRLFTWRDGVRPGNPALTQDSEGYIWSDGPIRYDGRAWQKIDVPGESGPVPSWSLSSAVRPPPASPRTRPSRSRWTRPACSSLLPEARAVRHHKDRAPCPRTRWGQRALVVGRARGSAAA